LNDTRQNRSKRNTLGKIKTRSFLYVIFGIILLFLDQILKQYFTRHVYYNNLFSLHLIRNTGMSFGFLQNKVLLMIIVSVLFLILLWLFRKEFSDCKLCVLLLVVGTIGNLIDRIFRGYVVDFFDLGWFPVFNLSDALITLGVIGIILVFLNDLRKDMKKKNAKNIAKKKSK
jgi:signal peptidase II